MTKAAVIGHPISHSLSAKLHGFLLDKYGIEGSYEAIDIPPENLESGIDFMLGEGDFAGFNVTIPHKERVFEIFKARNWKMTAAARAVGAINTVYKEGGEIVAANSDVFGFAENLRFFAGDLSGKAAVLGAGGAARAAVFALIELGFSEIIIVNRTLKRAQNLAAFMQEHLGNGQTLRALGALETDIDLLVNTTSLGMAGHGSLDLDISSLPRDATVYDIVYNPLMTQLLQDAQKHGNPTVTGIGMLIFQAFEGFERWFGVSPTLTRAEFEELSKLLTA